ncbi:sigma-70 family RNA polymerase sigma factor [Fulvivirgaceae bacterium BMA12]|uniref:Sigma-70 family RNA polymerase sigma factor n=1 Tax=Agaribacillus aureus TaxID=3051825 RepID=A0ABT8LAU0_9BACT|nr:sigma-70 family RNA polymerase sigma factor [Fulvivirgaceae bacterium BMA12]
MGSLSETEIITRAKSGDTRAFRILVERYQSMMFSVSCRFLDKDEAEDIVQEAFIRLWKNLHKYRPGIKLTTWLYRIVTNLCLDQLKSKHRRNRFRRADITEIDAVKDHSTPDKELEGRELLQYVLQLAQSLTPKQRAVFILRDLEGLSSDEVCEVLSMKAGNVKSNLYYARKALHEKLKQYFEVKERRLLL